MHRFVLRSTLILAVTGLAVLLAYPDSSFAETGVSKQLPQWRRDPFTPSLYMYEQLGNQTQPGFIPSLGQGKIPQMKLLGLIIKKKNKHLALLNIQGIGTFMVREGDEFNIDPARPRTAIRISKITRLSVTVETGRMGRIQVLR